MPIDIYKKEFQNWLKGVFGLNTTRSALCNCISGKVEDFLKDISRTELKQFLCCLKANQIYELKTQAKYVKQWECKHDSCRNLMERFVDNHTEKHSLKYKWKLISSSTFDNTGHGYEDKNLTWSVMMLYKHIDRNESAESYESLECLDISHVIKVMRYFKLSAPDGSAEAYDEVLKSRNKLMHSASNTMDEEETRDILTWNRKLLDSLHISEETYYKEAVEYLQDIAEEDFVIQYQSKESKLILEEVLKAETIAGELYKDIDDENPHCKKQSRQLLEMLEKIDRFRCSKNKRLEIKQTEYNLKIKDTLVTKQKAILMDKTESDVKSKQYKELKKLEEKTSQEIEELKKMTQTPEPEEMAELIEKLKKEIETFKEERKHTTAKVMHDSELSEKIEDISKKVETLNKEMEQRKTGESLLKEKTEEQAKKIENLARIVNSIEHDRGKDKTNENNGREMKPGWNLTDGSQRCIHALYDYDATMEGDLSFKKGDTLTLLDQGDEKNGNWLFARHTDSSYQGSKFEGYVPKNYVVIKDTFESQEWYFGKETCKETERNFLAAGGEVETFLVRESENCAGSQLCIHALYDYDATMEMDLSFKKGDTLTFLDQGDEKNEDWLFARHTDPSYQNSKFEGYVPRNYVVIQDNLESDCFFGKETRKESERKLLANRNESGTFLIRDSETCPGRYILSIKDYDQTIGDCVKHYKLNNKDGCVYISARQPFTSIMELVDYYKSSANGLCQALKYPCPRADPDMSDLSAETKVNWEIPRESLQLVKKLGDSKFSEVWEGKFKKTTFVAVKTLKPGTMTREAFLAEAKIIKECRHDKLVRLYAVCTKEEPFYLITRLLNYSLLYYLREGEGRDLKFPEIVDMAGQIASGMAYLESHKIIHRYLSARNILVCENNDVKVADYGLSRGTQFPIRWTAPEVAMSQTFTIKSDVWSYGILLVELATHGEVPYAGMRNSDVLKSIKEGYVHDIPRDIPKPMYEMMLKCWKYSPEERPTFEFLSGFFQKYPIATEPVYIETDI